MIADELVEEVRAQADILQIVGEHVDLRRSGRTYRGPCPLHGGDGPNFSVDPERGIFKCFVCGEGGDVFSFPMKLLGLEFLDAVRFVAERSGVEIPDRNETVREDPHKDLREALSFAVDWFQSQLWEEEGGSGAREYLVDKRGLPEEAVRKYGVGYAPDSWRALREAAEVHDLADELLIRAGLIKETERAKEPFDVFRGRLMFPIYDVRGRPIGFGGRDLTGSQDAPKYINSQDSPIFHKGHIVYGLNWSRHAIRREESMMIVEGYMDFISLGAGGIDNVAAPLGTALTEWQAKVLARYAQKALLLYDSDQAGLRATFKAADQLLAAGIHPNVVTLPGGEDPDSIVRRGGAAALAEYTDAALDVVDRKIQILEKRGYLDNIDGKRRAVDALLPTVRATKDEALRDIYLDRVAAVTGVQRGTLQRELRRSPRRGQVARAGPGTGTETGAAAGPSREEPGGAQLLPRLGAERKLLLLLIRDPTLVPGVKEVVELDDFIVSSYRDIYEVLLEAEGEGELEDEGLEWTNALPGPLQERARELAADPEELTNPMAVLDDVIATFRRRRIDRLMSDLRTEMRVAEPNQQIEIATRIQKLQRERAALGSPRPGGSFFKSG